MLIHRKEESDMKKGKVGYNPYTSTFDEVSWKVFVTVYILAVSGGLIATTLLFCSSGAWG